MGRVVTALADDLERLLDQLEQHGFRSIDIYTLRQLLAAHRTKGTPNR